MKCVECGTTNTYAGKSRMHAYDKAMSKGWGACGLEKWLCGKCWDKQAPGEGEYAKA